MCHSNDESSCCMAEQVNMSSSSSKRRIAAKSGQSGAKSGEKKALELSDGMNDSQRLFCLAIR